MNMKKISIVLFTLGFVFIISGSFSMFLQGLRDDKQQILNRMDDVGDEFEVFSTNTSVFEEYRDNLYDEVLEGILCDNLKNNNKDISNKLSNYEHLVDELDSNVLKLSKLCDDVYYPDSETNKKCLNYKIIYEQAVNYFVNDIKVYNDSVGKCNKEFTDGSKIGKYKTNKKYIDYNNDKKYDGKEEK